MSQPEADQVQSSGSDVRAPAGRKPAIQRLHAVMGRPGGASVANGLAGLALLRVLFVGRPATADALLAVLQDWPDAPLPENAVPVVDGDDALHSIVLVTVTNQKAALQEVRLQPPRVVLVETEVAAGSRMRFCEMMRHRVPTALIMAVAGGEPQTHFAYDGWLAYPFVAADVYAALHSARAEAAGHVLQRGPIRLNTATRTVITPNGRHHMTPKQCALLHLLMLNVNQVVSRTRLMADIWETSFLEDTRTLDVHVRWLRERIEPDPSTPVYLLTERGKGYMLRVE